LYADQLIGEICSGAGGIAVSNNIVSVISLLILSNASLNLIYTVFTQSHVDSVHDLLVEHHVQFVGFELSQYAISIPFIHASLGHVIFSITHV
jgi:hypothetical protein